VQTVWLGSLSASGSSPGFRFDYETTIWHFKTIAAQNAVIVRPSVVESGRHRERQ
jgi:hypothetical protein